MYNFPTYNKESVQLIPVQGYFVSPKVLSAVLLLLQLNGERKPIL